MGMMEESVLASQNIFRFGGALAQRRLANLAWFLVFEAAFYIAYHFAMSFSQAMPSPFWFPDSVLLCALLRSKPRYWWIFLLGVLPIRLWSTVARDVPLWVLSASYLLDSGKGLVAALALRRFLIHPLRLESIRDFIVFVLIAVLLVPAAFAFGGATMRAALDTDYWTTWKQWFMGDALAQLIVTPAILCLLMNGSRNLRALSPLRRIEAAASIGGLVVTGYMASHMGVSSTLLAEPRFYAPILFLFWTAIRFGLFGGSVAVMIYAALFVEAAVEGRGPFAGQSPADLAAALQNYLLPRCLALYLVALSVEQARRAESLFRESDARFRMVANSAPVMIWMSRPDMLCDFFNDTWLAFTGRPLEAELGNGWAEGVHPQDIAHCLDVYRTAFDARQPFEMEYRLRRRDGKYRWILDLGIPRYAVNGDFVGYIGSAVDITDRKRAEELSGTLAHLQRVSVMGELSAAISHEIRQPLNAILMNTAAVGRMLESGEQRLPELRDVVFEIREDILRANEVINRTQALARKQETLKAAVDINATILDVLHLLAGEAAQRFILFRTQLDHDLPPVFGNQTQLQQVLLNVIVNGMDAMKDARPAARELVLRSALREHDTIEIVVTDRGSGVAPELLPQLFEPFFTTKENGLGLGLAVSRTIIEAHRGRIWAENNPDAGLSVHFTLPAA
jgi:PAS domain S-box-containing protein